MAKSDLVSFLKFQNPIKTHFLKWPIPIQTHLGNLEMVKSHSDSETRSLLSSSFFNLKTDRKVELYCEEKALAAQNRSGFHSVRCNVCTMIHQHGSARCGSN